MAPRCTGGRRHPLPRGERGLAAGDGGRAVAELERAVLHVGGFVLRYGQFYGPGTYHEGQPPSPPRVHVDEAARRTVEARAGVLEILDPK